MTKEQIYDEQINPLMEQIIAICNEHKIANLCSFSLINDDEDSMCCTSMNLTEEFNPPEQFLKAAEIIKPSPRASAMITVRGADGTVKEVIAIVG